MSDLPNPQSYYIFLNISVSTRKPFGAIIKDGQEVLRAIWGQKRAWTLTYDDRDNGICMFYDTESGGSLGLKNSVSNRNSIFRVTDPGVEAQRWKLNKVGDDSFTIQLVTPVLLELFWYVHHAGAEIKAVAATSTERTRAWRFEAVDGSK
ncbi:hypothetical protein M405DRAFT_858037 [Rhizopogon salebrosus TDB-379]|nr:hypothetical protein M405DRAFT_858037 [Rhizopogon salebrosus TDB-379]